MGILNASTSFTRLMVAERVPGEFWQTVPGRLKQFAMRDIDTSHDERAFGWVSFEDMLDPEWSVAPPDKGGYLVFSLRLDTRRIPPAVLKKHIALAQRDEMARQREMGKSYISRDRKVEIKEQVKLRLLGRFLPIPAEFNVVWNTQTQVIFFASTQAKMVDMFCEYFTRTFELAPEPLTPYQLAATLLSEAELDRLDEIDPTSF